MRENESINLSISAALARAALALNECRQLDGDALLYVLVIVVALLTIGCISADSTTDNPTDDGCTR